MTKTSGSPDRSGPARAGRPWPLFRSLNSYRLPFLTRDLFAGLTLAAIVIPEQMATARLGGFAPQIGFFAFLAGFVDGHVDFISKAIEPEMLRRAFSRDDRLPITWP